MLSSLLMPGNAQGARSAKAAGSDMVANEVTKAAEEASSLGFTLNIEFDNDTDPSSTVITVSGQDHTDLLSQMTGAFNSMDMVVMSATISTTRNGEVLDVFRVTEDDKKVSFRQCSSGQCRYHEAAVSLKSCIETPLSCSALQSIRAYRD